MNVRGDELISKLFTMTFDDKGGESEKYSQSSLFWMRDMNHKRNINTLRGTHGKAFIGVERGAAGDVYNTQSKNNTNNETIETNTVVLTHTPGETTKHHQKNSDCTHQHQNTASTSRATSGRKGKCSARNCHKQAKNKMSY